MLGDLSKQVSKSNLNFSGKPKVIIDRFIALDCRTVTPSSVINGCGLSCLLAQRFRTTASGMVLSHFNTRV